MTWNSLLKQIYTVVRTSRCIFELVFIGIMGVLISIIDPCSYSFLCGPSVAFLIALAALIIYLPIVDYSITRNKIILENYGLKPITVYVDVHTMVACSLELQTIHMCDMQTRKNNTYFCGWIRLNPKSKAIVIFNPLYWQFRYSIFDFSTDKGIKISHEYGLVYKKNEQEGEVKG